LLEEWLRAANVGILNLSLWDDIVVGSHLREYASLKTFRGDAGIGSPEKPLCRRDKNVTSAPVTLLRTFFYLADAISLRLKIHKIRKREVPGVVIFDRYLYDELANLPLQNSLCRHFAKRLLRIAPSPDVAFIIDADPAIACARKPEYPLEFVNRNRESYLALSRMLPEITVVEGESIDAMEEKIRETVAEKLPVAHIERFTADPYNPNPIAHHQSLAR